MYEKKFINTPETVMVDGFELPIPMPVMPHLKYIENYGRALSEQKFRRTEIPVSVIAYGEALDQYYRDLKEGRDVSGHFAKVNISEAEAFIKQEWHRRKHGVWVFIKGRPYYIPGAAYFFFNYWKAEVGTFPDFRMEALEFFWVWDYAERSGNCFGLDVIKCRRLGVTEKALCAGYEYSTRYFNSWFGMQNVTEDEAMMNYQRVVTANKDMIFFFKPLHTHFLTNDAPKEAIVFRHPQWLVQGKVKFGELRSRIDYKASKVKLYDGKRLRFYHLDEPGKISDADMEVLKVWDVIRFTLMLKNKHVVGKAMLTTTVEQIKNGNTVHNMRKLWGDSDPNELTETGRTKSGLWRYFIDYTRTADTDEWGFHLADEAKKFRDSDIASFVKKQDFDGLADYKRRMPSTIDEALAIPSNECILYPALLDIQSDRILKWETDPAMQMFLEVRGSLVWTKGAYSKVAFVPNPTGDWHISQHPDNPNAVVSDSGGFRPAQAGSFTIGVDGIDHVKPQDRGSQGGIVIYRPRNEMLEMLEIGEDGSYIYPEKMKTDRFVAVYKGRPKKPTDFYEEAVKAAWYYGSMIFAERQKPGVMTHFIQNRLGAFLAYKPTVIKIGAKKEISAGMHTSKSSVDLGISLLQEFVANRYHSMTIKSQISQFRAFTGENMPDLDIVAASMFALMAAQRKSLPKGGSAGWKHNPYDF